MIAVTLVVDCGIYVNTGDTKKFNAAMEVCCFPGVTVQSGNFYDTGILLEYWGPASGSFPAVAARVDPLTSDLPFGKTFNGGVGEVTMQADGQLFATAAAKWRKQRTPSWSGLFPRPLRARILGGLAFRDV